MEFSVMTYNIGLGLESDLESVARVIEAADVAAIQEVGYGWIEGEGGNQAQKISKMSGLNHFRFAASMTVRPGSDPPEMVPAPTPEDRPGHGVALLSRFPLGPWTRHRLPRREDTQRCILSGTVVTPRGPMSVLVTHLSRMERDRRAQVGALLRHAQTQATPLLLLGDLGADIDDEILAQLNGDLKNAAGNSTQPTFPASAPEVALDHVYVSQEVQVVSATEPISSQASRHLPVVARLSL